MVDPEHSNDVAVQAALQQLVRIVHRYLPQTGLSARERVEVRRDLLLLIAESHRHVPRHRVAVEVCASVLSVVAHALPEQSRATLLNACAPHIDEVRAASQGRRPYGWDP